MSDTFFAIDNPGIGDRDDAIRYQDEVLGVVVPRIDVSADLIHELMARPETRYRATDTLPMLGAEQEAQYTLRQGVNSCVRLEIAGAGEAHGKLGVATIDPAVSVLVYPYAAAPYLKELQAWQSVVSSGVRVGVDFDWQEGWALVDGERVAVPARQRNNGFLMVARAMLFANAAVAEWARERNVPWLYRRHDGAGLPAYYAAEPGPHHALRTDCYCHFTSPLRRLPDLICQHNMAKWLNGDSDFLPTDTLAEKINEYHTKQQAVDSAQFKQWASAEAEQKGHEARPEQLAREPQFLRILKNLPQQAECPLRIAEAVRLRITARQLSTHEAAYLLFIRGWCRHEVLSAGLRLIEVFNLGAQSGWCPSLHVEAMPSEVKVCVNLGSTSLIGVGQDKAAAIQTALYVHLSQGGAQ